MTISLVDNPAGLAIGIGIIIFAVVYQSMIKIGRIEKGVGLLIAFIISAIASWYLYNNGFYGQESLLAVIIYVVIAGIFLKIIWAFIKSIRKSFGH